MSRPTARNVKKHFYATSHLAETRQGQAFYNGSLTSDLYSRSVMQRSKDTDCVSIQTMRARTHSQLVAG